MALKTKIEPIADFLEVAVSDLLSPEAQKRAVAAFARERLQEAQQQNQRILGRIPPHQAYVDGRQGAPLESVNVQRGVIVFEFELIGDVLRWIAQTLLDRSPVRSGNYRDGHTLFADGQPIAIGAQMPPADEYSFTNLVPYSRKIEIGRTRAGRAFVLQVPNRIYERTAREAQARFGNLAKIEFTYRGVVGLSSGAGTQVNPLRDPTRGAARARTGRGRFASMGGPKAYNVSSVRYPTIVVHLGDRFTRR